MYMNGKDFLSKIRTRLEIKNTAFVYIQRDNTGHVIGFYPVPYSYFEALEYNNGLFIKFYFSGDAASSLVLPWQDLAVLRKDYNDSDVSGDENTPVLNMLELINTTNQGVANAVKATANLRGILKSTKAMLSSEDIKKNKENFVKDYLNLENEGGIASLDATQEFTPIKMEPTITDHEQMKEFRENVYRYFGISDAIVMSDYTESQMEAFYEARIEPFLVALSLELTRKVFTDRQLGFQNEIIYESNRMQYASTTTKLAMVALVDRGALTPNEWRFIFNLAPVEGGDVPIRRLDTAQVNEQKGEDENESEG
jgi:HK97 family phage portal protein